jgi:geranyl-CoA carboxylase beta subunit
MGLRKSLRAQEIALENRLPIVSLVESGGANLLHQSELFVEGGRVFRNMARASAAGLPQITVVHGSSTAGGAYLPGLSDYVIVVRDRAKVFLAGPPLVKAAIGEDADEERLGGAMLHAAVTGSAEYVADDDAHAIRLARELVSHLGWRVAEPPAHAPAPRLDAEELLGVVPIDRGTPWDVREIVGRIVDDSEFLELAPDFGRATVCGHAAIEGIACGIVGNNGPFDPDGSCKAAHFVQLCHQAGLPIVYLQNTPGFLVGTDAERRGAIKHGSKLIQAVANAAVPQVTLLVGGGYGAGNYAMCGRALDPRFVFAWPNSRVAVMGGGQAAMVMKTVALAKQARSGTPADPAALDQAAAALRERIDRESSALFATARVWDDGIIDPRDSRRVLGLCLATSAPVDRRNPNRTSFGVARM